MIASLTEIKTFLNITGTDKDDIIKLNMPIVESFICTFCKNDFIEYTDRLPSSPRVYILADDLTFVNSTNSLDSTSTDFTTYRFGVGDNVKIYGSYHNSGVFTIASIASNSIVFDSLNTVKNENYGDNLIIARVVYPDELKKLYAFMINFNINKDNIKGLQSESILGYSYSISPTNKSSYPDSAINDLYNYRKILKRPLFNATNCGVEGVDIYGY